MVAVPSAVAIQLCSVVGISAPAVQRTPARVHSWISAQQCPDNSMHRFIAIQLYLVVGSGAHAAQPTPVRVAGLQCPVLKRVLRADMAANVQFSFKERHTSEVLGSGTSDDLYCLLLLPFLMGCVLPAVRTYLQISVKTDSFKFKSVNSDEYVVSMNQQ
ncbi:hypothetical protein MHYP_G00306590 [Metynnis hypsauchen]